MSDSANPYQAPAADLDASENTANANAFTPGMVQALKDTKPWVRFLSILGFVFTGFGFLAGLGIIGVGLVSGEAFGGAGMAALIGVFYLILAGLWLLPLIHLHKYANAIASAVSGPRAQSVEEALARQRSFWRTVGIMTLVFLVLYFGALFVVMIAGIVTGMSSL